MFKEDKLAFLALCLFAVGCIFLTCGLSAKSNSPRKLVSKETIVLTKKNTALLKGEVNSESVAQLENSLKTLSRTLQPSDVIYLVMDTPGGSIDAGLDLVDFINGLPQKVKTLSLRSYSMGFYIVQLLDERLALENSEMMEHPGSFGISGPTLQVLSKMKQSQKHIEDLNRKVSKRIGISLEKFLDLIHDDLWLSGSQAFEMNAVDRLVNARCDSSLDGTYKALVFNFPEGAFTAIYSNCPLIREPLEKIPLKSETE